MSPYISAPAAVMLWMVAASAGAAEVATPCREASPPVLATAGTALTLDGRPAFVVLASYFDAMRASRTALASDFAFLKSKGVGGVRVFPLWIRDGQDPSATLLDPQGLVRSGERWQHFLAILQSAAACGMVVDVTFNRDMLTNTVTPMSLADYRSGIAEVIRRLKGTHPHVFVDLQNERNRGIPGMDYTREEIAGLRDALKAADAARLVMCSTLGGVQESLALVKAARLDIAAFHEGQEKRWFLHTPAIVAALRQANVPVYLQEMARAPDRGVPCEGRPDEPNAFIEAVRAARQAGAAAWTFHTDAGFRLDREAFQDRVRACGREREFLDTLAAALD